MKIRTNTKTQGFTLIEMIGVLAVIAILAALLVPKVFNAINDSKVNTVPVGIATIKAAVVEHYSKYGSFDNIKGTPMSTTVSGDMAAGGYDKEVLLVEGLIDKAFMPKVGTNAYVMMRTAGVALDGATTGINAGYDLDGSSTDGSAGNDVNGQYVLDVKIAGVPLTDALAISERIDGTDLSATSTGAADLKGRVKYAWTSGAVSTDVYIYLTHR